MLRNDAEVQLGISGSNRLFVEIHNRVIVVSHDVAQFVGVSTHRRDGNFIVHDFMKRKGDVVRSNGFAIRPETVAPHSHFIDQMILAGFPTHHGVGIGATVCVEDAGRRGRGKGRSTGTCAEPT